MIIISSQGWYDAQILRLLGSAVSKKWKTMSRNRTGIYVVDPKVVVTKFSQIPENVVQKWDMANGEREWDTREKTLGTRDAKEGI